MSYQPMTAREFLGQVQYIEAQIRDKTERVNELHEMMTNTARKLRDMPKAASPNQQPLERLIAAAVDLQNTITADLELMREKYDEVASVILQVENKDQRAMLRSFYLDNRSIEDVADLMQFSVQHVRRFHTKGLAAVDKILAASG